MNEDMLAKARHNASTSHITNTSFVYSRITTIDLPYVSVDVVISNCVINLVPHEEKPLVFKEMHRILKPGGRVAVSDILLRKPLPEALKSNVALYVGCIAGASMKEEYETWLKEARFENVLVVDAGSDLNVYTSGDDAGATCCGPRTEPKDQKGVETTSCCGEQPKSDGGVAEDMRRNLRELDLNEWARSFKVLAVKK